MKAQDQSKQWVRDMFDMSQRLTKQCRELGRAGKPLPAKVEHPASLEEWAVHQAPFVEQHRRGMEEWKARVETNVVSGGLNHGAS